MQKVTLSERIDPLPRAAPLPVLRSSDEAGPDGICGDVLHDGQQVTIAFDKLAPIASLENVAVANRSVIEPEIASVSTLNEVHVRRNCLEVVDARDQMK